MGLALEYLYGGRVTGIEVEQAGQDKIAVAYTKPAYRVELTKKNTPIFQEQIPPSLSSDPCA